MTPVESSSIIEDRLLAPAFKTFSYLKVSNPEKFKTDDIIVCGGGVLTIEKVVPLKSSIKIKG
jgi:hypothetical protein